MTVVGGGETAMAFNQMGLADGIKHISTGGGACISFMSGETMPALEAMRRSKNDLTIKNGHRGFELDPLITNQSLYRAKPRWNSGSRIAY